MNFDSFLEMVNIRYLLQENLIAQLYYPKISLELMSGIGSVPSNPQLSLVLFFQETFIFFFSDCNRL
ncbi:hypothetical protein SAMN03080617_04243 [Algoriphagus alkaliphilus]|uniref:Uncharacterized protein n=1 Tax=Algoriphagus alkaliphilus TaxID=279824 RepID=A0A1G5ZNW2_9BACT|nr:hypothetical protein SAMN03080617_04243 [Algoriphagus alkaliphilus]